MLHNIPPTAGPVRRPRLGHRNRLFSTTVPDLCRARPSTIQVIKSSIRMRNQTDSPAGLSGGCSRCWRGCRRRRRRKRSAAHSQAYSFSKSEAEVNPRRLSPDRRQLISQAGLVAADRNPSKPVGCGLARPDRRLREQPPGPTFYSSILRAEKQSRGGSAAGARAVSVGVGFTLTHLPGAQSRGRPTREMGGSHAAVADDEGARVG